jgi:TolB-like protein/Tfp pilus assembly protein PilF
MQVYRQLAKREMSAFPDSKTQWHSYWQSNLPIQDDEEFEQFFELLVDAGLLQQDEESTDEVPSIAVLPFENMSGDPEQAFFSDGITADIIATLSKFRHLRIVARHSTEIYRERKASIAEIATEQGVRYILEGSVRKSGKRIRVSAELIDSQGEQVCWSERYDRDLDDLFAVQDEITRQITLAMKIHLDDGEMALNRSGTSNLKAWELTLAAGDLQDTYIRQNILEARSMAQQAVELDPDYGFAQVVLGWTYWQEVYSGWSESPEDSLAKADECCQRALQSNPDYADALNMAGIGYMMRHEVDKALEYCRRSIEIEPGNADNQALTAWAYIFVGDFEQARVHQQNARRLCPVMPNWFYLVDGQIEQFDGDLDKAVELFEQGLAVVPDSPLCRYYLVHALMQRGDHERAGILADEIRSLDPGVTGSGLVRSFSQDAARRDQFREHLAQFDLV